MSSASRRPACVALSGLLALALAYSAEAPEKVLPAINEIEPWQQVGQQPYEFTWTQRREDPHTLVDFEDLKGWKLELYGGARGEFHRSREQQLWGQYVGKFLYAGTRPESRMIARPPAPIPIPARFDSVDMWGYGNRWGHGRKDHTPPVYDVSVLIRDAAGREFKVQLADIRWKQWWLMHRKVPADVLAQIAWPATFSGIELAMGESPELRYFFCDSLAFYQEELKPVALRAQPKRNLQPFHGQIVGMNTGQGTLPFPTREETILPSNLEKEFRVTVRQSGANQFELRYAGRDAAVTYVYRPKTGAMAELTVSVNGGPPFRPMDGGGVRFTDTPPGRVAEGELVAAQLSGDVVEARFRYGSRLVNYQFRLWQKSLLWDVWCDGHEASELSFGRVSGLANPRLITVPYITYRPENPRVLLSGSEAKPLFTSIWFDWYRSNASEPYAAEKPQVGADGAEINGGMRYLPRTDGVRNNLCERIFLTNSPIYEETLPTIPNPPSQNPDGGKQVVWTVTAPPTFQWDHRRSREIRSYGLDKIMQHSHEVTWRDEGDSFTMRLHAAPQKGGDAMLRWYIQAQLGLGWRQGVYTNYTDFAPVNTNWNPDFVQRLPDGEWRRAWMRNYALKPAKAVEMDAYYAPRIQSKFGTRMSYTDVHTAVAPWEYVDFDARVPGSGTFAATFYAYGQLLLNDQRVYGIANSEGTFQWLYAGLESGSYGWVYTDVNLLAHPVDVAFHLLKIHPLQCDYGMGSISRYLAELDPKWMTSPRRREYADLFLATTIAYGNMGWLLKEFDPSQPLGVEIMARSYYMMQQLQQQYAFVLPKTIEYADRLGRFLSPSQAHATGAIALSRLHVTYENGTEVYVNRSAKEPWTVKDPGGQAVELPVSGWLAFRPENGFYELSANSEGRRIDYVKAPEFEFLDGRGQWTERGRLGAEGSVALRSQAGGRLQLIDICGNSRIAFAAAGAGTLLAYDPEGNSLGEVKLRSPHPGWWEFAPAANGRTYIFVPRAN
ncbi:MAG TPA: hypothetical protein VFA33_03400 [Bryobacteraceae bacterium]|nr:hypothetical protein [Bryobacteraceae bacterium]